MPIADILPCDRPRLGGSGARWASGGSIAATGGGATTAPTPPRAGEPRFARTREQWDAPGARLRLVDGDTTLLPGIELIETGGHVPGHQSVLVRLTATGPVLLAIDAIPHALGEHTPENRPTGSADMDEAATRAGTRKLIDLAAREGVALIVCGHDAEEWKILKKAPEFYT